MKIDAEDNIATMDNIYMNFIREDFLKKNVRNVDVTSKNKSFKTESWEWNEFFEEKTRFEEIDIMQYHYAE